MQSSLCFANDSIEIIDPDKRIRSIPFQSAREDWDKSFKCNQAQSFFIKTGKCQIHCEYGLCQEECAHSSSVESTIQPEDCTADSVQLYSAHGHSWTITKSEYEMANKTVILSFIKSLNLFYEPIEKIKISDVIYPIPKKIIENGKMKQIMVASIVFDLYPNKNEENFIGFDLQIDLNQSGLNQLICFGVANGCVNSNEYMIKRKGVINAVP